jgi:serine/threonine protein kinase
MTISPVVKFSDIQIKSYMKQLLTGMDYMHTNKILHRDIKSQNLFITRFYFFYIL